MKSKEVTVNEIAVHLGVKSRSAQELVKKWSENNFVKVINPSKKSRTYSLTIEWEQLISKNQD
jgi:Mn-dependent DtxR family transcriptional regulator